MVQPREEPSGALMAPDPGVQVCFSWADVSLLEPDLIKWRCHLFQLDVGGCSVLWESTCVLPQWVFYGSRVGKSVGALMLSLIL